MALIPLEQALDQTFGLIPKPKKIDVSLPDSLSFVLAQSIRADMFIPPFDKSAVDGYAVSFSTQDVPQTLKVVGLSKAGARWSGKLQTGEACQIMTGAPVPEGTDRIIMVEDTTREGEDVLIHKLGKTRQHIHPRGIEVCQNDQVLNPNTLIRPPEMGTLATFGCAQVPVFRKPQVAVLATGDELVEPQIKPNPDQIRNSNGYSLTAQIQSNSFPCKLLGVAKDTLESTAKKIEEALEYDVLILSGGVSMGEFDYVKEVLLEKGAEFQFEKIALKPGKPLVVGKVQNTFIFGLPGNPGSSFTTCELFVIPFLKGFAGHKSYRTTPLEGVLDFNYQGKGPRIQYLPVIIHSKENQHRIYKVPYAGSSDVVALSRSNGFLIVQPEQTLKAGETAPCQYYSFHQAH